MGYLGAMLWAFDQADGVTFYRQLHPLWSVFILLACTAPMLPLLAGEFTHWLVTEVSGKSRWGLRQWPIIYAGLGLSLHVGFLQAPIWLVAVTLIPFTLAFVYPGFAFPSLANAREMDWNRPSLAPTWLHWLGLVSIAVLVIAAWFPQEFYSLSAREGGGFKVPGIVI